MKNEKKTEGNPLTPIRNCGGHGRSYLLGYNAVCACLGEIAQSPWLLCKSGVMGQGGPSGKLQTHFMLDLFSVPARVVVLGSLPLSLSLSPRP